MSSRLEKFGRLPWKERWTIVEAAAICAVVRLMLATTPYGRVSAMVGRVARRSGRGGRLDATGEEVARVVRAVGAASSAILGTGQCLVRALAAQVMLGRRGYRTEVKFGVEKDGDGVFGAHAWLERDGRVLIGGGVEPGRYAPLGRTGEKG